MSQIEKALDGLIQAIKDSPEYRQYQEIRAKVHGYPDLERQIHVFRKKNYELQNTVGNWDLFEQVDRLDSEYADFLKQPLVDEYITAEVAFCRVIQNVNWSIIRNIDFEVGFVNE